jgi:lipopolysaccharide export system protein LptA
VRHTAALIVAAMISAVPLAHAASPTAPRPVSTSPAATAPASSSPTVAAPATAPSGPPNALQGFSQNRDKPLKISSASLEVRDKDKVATFSGDVHLVQGDTTLRSKTLVVFYDDESDAAKQDAAKQDGASKPDAQKPAKPPAGAANANADAAPISQQIRRVEAKGGVLVTQKEQSATGESGIFDMQANTVTLLGNVVISQGQNVVRGDRLTVDLTSGVSRVECGKTQGQCRVQALIQPNSMKGDKEKADKEKADKDKPGTEAPAATGSVRDAPRPRAPTSGLY